MRTIGEVMDCCRIDDDSGCWNWARGTSSGNPRIHAPDWTLHGGALSAQNGKRAVWHIGNGKAIPKGWRVYSKCMNQMCVNPAHIKCGPVAEFGKHLVKTGHFKNSTARAVANRLLGQTFTKATPEIIAELLSSNETNQAAGARFGLSRQVVYRIRRGRSKAFHPIGGMFSGLGSRA